jgi:hypothetical protein
MQQYRPKYYSRTAVRLISQTPLLQLRSVPYIVLILTASLRNQRKKVKLLLLPWGSHSSTYGFMAWCLISLGPKYPLPSSSGFPVLKDRASSGLSPLSLLGEATLACRFAQSSRTASALHPDEIPVATLSHLLPLPRGVSLVSLPTVEYRRTPRFQYAQVHTDAPPV